MKETKAEIYLKLIKKSHRIFLEYLTHIPKEVLDWTITTNANTTRWVLFHTLKEQQWLANLITDKNYSVEYSESLTLQELITVFTDFFQDVENNIKNLDESFFNQLFDHKNFKMSGEDWLYEYIHHFSFHSGEIGFYLKQWKRKNRSLKK